MPCAQQCVLVKSLGLGLNFGLNLMSRTKRQLSWRFFWLKLVVGWSRSTNTLYLLLNLCLWFKWPRFALIVWVSTSIKRCLPLRKDPPSPWSLVLGRFGRLVSPTKQTSPWPRPRFLGLLGRSANKGRSLSNQQIERPYFYTLNFNLVFVQPLVNIFKRFHSVASGNIVLMIQAVGAITGCPNAR